MPNLNHIRHLSITIGPRGSARKQETQAAQGVEPEYLGQHPAHRRGTRAGGAARAPGQPPHTSGVFHRPPWIAIDSVGGRGASPAYLTQETFLLTAKSDPGLLEVAERAATRRPGLDAYAHHFRGAYTERAIGAKHGFRVLTLVGHRRDGVLPDRYSVPPFVGWHRPTDVIENVDPDTVRRPEEFLWEALQELDREAGRSL